MQTILAGFGDHPHADASLRWAEDLARAESAELVVMSVFQRPFAEMDPEVQDRLVGEKMRQTETIVEELGDDNVITEIKEGKPREALVEEAEEVAADLVVIAKADAVGHEGFGVDGPRHWLLHHAHRAVAVVTPDPLSFGDHPIVIGVDGTKANAAAMQLTEDLAAAVGSRVIAVFAYDPIDDTYTHRGGWHQHSDNVRLEVSTILGAPTQFVMEGGKPEAVLCKIAAQEHAAAIVVGTRGAASLHGRLVGNIPTHLLDNSPCPFIVVPHDEEAER